MKRHQLITAATFLCINPAGCACFDHQTTKREPHALVTIGKTSESSAQGGTLKSLDRLPVNVGATFRVRPGKHVVVMEFIERLVDGKMQWVKLSIEQRQRREVSRFIVVQAGKHYRLVGDQFMPCHLLLP